MTDEENRRTVAILVKSSLDTESIMKMLEIQIVDKTMSKNKKNLIDKTMELENGQKMSIGKLVRHRTVSALGIGLVVQESKVHKGFWMIQWCDPRYYDVGNLGIDEQYLEIL